MLRGLTTVSFWADDVKAAAQWYGELLGMAPYFARPDAENPSYVEFRIGDYQHELGIISRAFAPKSAAPGPGGATVYWHVDDVQATLDKLMAMGATEYEPLLKRGEGFVTAAVVDPFGNVLGIMYNAHYLATLAAIKK